jgi:cytochrome c oxidase cbb3-type subunit 3
MTDKKEDRLLDHEYDGIQEYDNPLPRWWLWIFYATIAFSVAYYFLPSPFGEGEGAIAQYEMEMEIARARAAILAPAASGVTNEELRALVALGSALADGKAVYDANCSACHRADGGGLIGPNLTDSYWIHGGSPVEIHLLVSEGVLAKGMPNWDRILGPEQLKAVTSYVLSMQGTNPPNAKAPEGSEVPTGP